MGTIRFLLDVVGAAAFIAMGLLMAVWPATHFRWVRWSEQGIYLPWLHGKWDLEHARRQAMGLGMVSGYEDHYFFEHLPRGAILLHDDV